MKFKEGDRVATLGGIRGTIKCPTTTGWLVHLDLGVHVVCDDDLLKTSPENPMPTKMTLNHHQPANRPFLKGELVLSNRDALVIVTEDQQAHNTPFLGVVIHPGDSNNERGHSATWMHRLFTRLNGTVTLEQ